MSAFEPFKPTDSFSMDTFNTKLGGAFDASLKIATGSYVGTGTYGKNNPNTLTFDFEPKLVIVMEQKLGSVYTEQYNPNGFLVIRDVSKIYCANAASEGVAEIITWGEKSVSWYVSASASSNIARNQLNSENITYSYLVIG